jgi:hypothetical protein
MKFQRSLMDGLPLPAKFNELSWHEKRFIADLIAERPMPTDSDHRWPEVWRELALNQRRRVINHVEAYRQRDKVYSHVAIRPETVYMGARQGGKSQVQEMIRQAYALGQNRPTGHYTLYPAPNGGNRMLPSLYCELRLTWVRADKTVVKPEAMNTGHLQNSLKLLNESHGNVVARATDLLGKMARHFQNSPGIVHMLTELCEAMQSVDVDEMYPIFDTLVEALETRLEYAESMKMGPPNRVYTLLEDLM